MTAPSQTIFVKSVTGAFGFLLSEYGYSCHVDSVDGAVVFANNPLFVRVFQEPGSCMIYVEVCRKDTDEEYALHEIIHALAPDETLSPQCSGADSTKMARCLNQLSQLFQQHLRGVLAMDSATLEKVASWASITRQQYTLEAQYGAIKDQANLAWERKEWETARKLYEDAEPGLSAGEKRRLDFLQKNTDQSGQ